jgi:hypothetical protein
MLDRGRSRNYGISHNERARASWQALRPGCPLGDGTIPIMTTNSEESRLDRAERLILGLAEQSDIIQQQVNLNSQAIQQLIQIQQETFERSESEMDSVKAAIARIDRIMDYLMRRDGDRPTEGGESQ